MKLLTPDAGWVEQGNTIHWTEDGGAHWTDITPVPADISRTAVTLRGVFLLDASQGWAVISYPELHGAAAGGKPLVVPHEALMRQKTLEAIAQTVDSGQTWSFTPFIYPRLPQWQQDTLAGPAGMFFLDSLHGWLDMAFEGNARTGKLLATEDGGRTWEWVNSPGKAGTVHFTTIRDGWLVGGPYEQLYSTHDGCKTWQEVQITPPPQVGAATDATVEGVPVFRDTQHGYVAVHYVGPEGTPSKLVVYSTKDAGKTWRAAKVVSEVEEVGALTYIPFSITDSVLIVPTGSRAQGVAVATVPLSGELDSGITLSTRSATRWSFVSTSHGLAARGDGRLLSTSDGGTTWKEVTPWHVFEPSPSRTPKKPPTGGPETQVKPGVSLFVQPRSTFRQQRRW